MTQSIILKKFQKYLKLIKEDYLAELEREKQQLPRKAEPLAKQQEEFKKHIDDLIKKLDTGHCFGFSLVCAAMAEMGKLSWWQAVLLDIAHWDEKRESLSKTVNLGETETTSSSPTARKIHFERALHYIALSHASKIAASYYPKITQTNILQPDSHVIEQLQPIGSGKFSLQIKRSFFEVLDEEAKYAADKIRTFKKTIVIAGTFTLAQLQNDLSDDFPENAVVLVDGICHTINIMRRGKNWIVYDPNYDHTKLAKMFFTGTKDACIKEILNILGNSFCIQVALYHEHTAVTFPEYEKLLAENSLLLLEKYGLWVMAKRTPEKLVAIFKKHSTSSQEREAFLKLLADSFTLKNTVDNWTALHFLADIPDALTEILRLIDNSSVGLYLAHNIIKLLVQTNSCNETPLFKLAYHSPDAFPIILDLVDKIAAGENLRAAILTSLCQPSNQGFTAFRFIGNKNHQLLLRAMRTAIKAEHGLQTFLSALQLQSKSDNKCHWALCFDGPRDDINAVLSEELIRQPLDLNRLSGSAEENAILRAAFLKVKRQKLFDGETPMTNLALYIKFQLERSDGLDTVLRDLSEKYVNNKTGWQIICDTMPAEKDFIMNAIVEHLRGIKDRNELARYETAIRQTDYVRWRSSPYRGICKQTGWFGGKYVRTALWRIMLDTIGEQLDKMDVKKQNEEKLSFQVAASIVA